MYIGRFVILGRTAAGEGYLAYRVSSRSFPNRTLALRGDRAMVIPTADAAPSDNPYISYNCLRTAGQVAIVANGSHADPIIEKVAAGYSLRDALALPLLALDYEHDQLNTPRIAAALNWSDGEGALAIVAADQLAVRTITLAPGQALLVATYECTQPTPITLAGETPETLCNAVYECEYELPVAALAAMHGAEGWRLASRSARS